MARPVDARAQRRERHGLGSRGAAPLVPRVAVVVDLEALVVLVHREVGEVRERLLQVGVGRRAVPLRAEAREALLEQQDAHRVARDEQHVEAQVELDALHQQRRRDVLLRHHAVHVAQLVRVLREEDAAPLAAGVWLHDQRRLAPLRAHVRAQRLELGGQVERGREEGNGEEARRGGHPRG